MSTRSLPVVFLAVVLATPVLARWVPDATRVATPSKPAVGRIHGRPFKVEKAELTLARASPDMPKRTTYFLKLRQGGGFFPDYEYSLTLLTPRGQKIDGQSFVVGPAGVFKMPGAIVEKNVSYPPVQGVAMTWKVPGKEFGDTDMMSRYTMRLEFGKRLGHRIAGRIYLSMQDPQKSWLAGTFVAEIKRL